MFTGLVKDIGKIKRVTGITEGKELVVESAKMAEDLNVDDSVAINGVCQTVVKVKGSEFTVQAVYTTLSKTTLNEIKAGDEVNLELALRLSDRLGGHLVQGHVNGLGKIAEIKKMGNNFVLGITVPKDLLKYMVKEGSVTLDGVSLTIAECDNESKIYVSIIPHTYQSTVLHNRTVGQNVNVEVDILAKYVENLLFHRENHKNSADLPPKRGMDWWISQGL